MNQPAVSVGLIGRIDLPENIADPAQDQHALSLEIIKSSRKRKTAKVAANDTAANTEEEANR
jgi:hypothetical protein